MKPDWGKYKEVEVASTTDRNWPERGQELKEGDYIEGIYRDARENVGPNKSSVFTLELEDGTKVGVWGSTVLDRKMKAVEFGQKVLIEFDGLKKGESGREYKDFKVGTRDEEYQAEVGPGTSG